MATRSRTRAAVAEPPLSPLLSERSVLLHEHAHAPLGGQFPPEVSDDDVWLPVAARDDVDDGGDIEYLAVLASAMQHGIQVEPRHTTFAVLGQHMMVALQYHGEDWQPVVMNDDVDDVDDRGRHSWV
ncbi:hypothetical protein AB1Y20_006603 [Prymnesium parvum]|uniref:Uncharacterized protein n=1 Tax=Prymnesium parvum TaxID=97485 RepID=A0AB34IY87_PRYPA